MTMANITSAILGSLRLKHLEARERWVWVALNLLDNGNGLICGPNGDPYSLHELSELIMLENDELTESMNILLKSGYLAIDEKNCIKLVFTFKEEQANRRRISARLRKRKQRSKGQVVGNVEKKTNNTRSYL